MDAVHISNIDQKHYASCNDNIQIWTAWKTTLGTDYETLNLYHVAMGEWESYKDGIGMDELIAENNCIP